MWVFYRITGSSSSTAKIFSRFRPEQRYLINVKGATELNKTVEFVVKPFSEQDVMNPRSRPDLILFRNEHSVIVDNRVVSDAEIHLHDQQVLHIGRSNSAYKISWEPVIIYHDRMNDPELHENLIEKGTKCGFHVIDHISGLNDKPTHYCISTNITEFEPSGNTFLSLALNNVYFVNFGWINELITADDPKFDLKAINDTIQPITIEDFRSMRQTAVFGPDERRKKLFKNMEFWFFDQQQLDANKELIKLVGGKAILRTCAQASVPHIAAGVLFIRPTNTDDLPDWPTAQQNFREQMGANRTLLPHEIQFAILFCSTNYMCNPLAHPEENLHPNSALYASFQSASIQISDEVKLESLDPTVPVTFPNDDTDFQHHHYAGDDDDLIEVKPERIECTQEASVRLEEEDKDREEHLYRRRVIKEEVVEDEEMQEPAAKSPTPPPPQIDKSVHDYISPVLSYPENVDYRVEEDLDHVSASSPAMSSSRDNNHEAEEQVELNTASSPIMSLDIMDIDAFLGGAFENLQSQKQKEREEKLEETKKAECKRQEEAKEAEIKRQQDEIIHQQEAEKNRKLQDQIERERLQYEEQLQRRIATTAVRPLEENVVMEPLDGSVNELEEETFQQEERANTDNDSSTNNDITNSDGPIDYRNDPTIIRIEEPDPSRGRYCRIIYRNLEVNPQPAKPANGAINYKRFKKVKQFENYSSFDSSQTFATAPSSSSSQDRRRGRDIFMDTDPGVAVPEDPDIVIRVNRPRFR